MSKHICRLYSSLLYKPHLEHRLQLLAQLWRVALAAVGVDGVVADHHAPRSVPERRRRQRVAYLLQLCAPILGGNPACVENTYPVDFMSASVRKYPERVRGKTGRRSYSTKRVDSSPVMSII